MPANIALSKQHRGAAIIAAMLVTATVAMLATGMLSQINGWFSRSEIARNTAQAQSLANAAVRWSAQYIAEESRLGPLDHLGELWATGIPATPIEGGTLGGAISDAQGKFNLNNTAKANGETSEPDAEFARSFLAKSGLPAAQISALFAAARTQSLTYSDIPTGLRNSFTALPVRTMINVNTAPDEIMRALVPKADPQSWQDRGVRPFTSAQDFAARVGFAAVIETGVSSKYFLVDVAAGFGSSQAGARALVERTQGVIWQVAR